MEAPHSTCLGQFSDDELVAAAKCGNTEAFEQLVFRYERRVIAVAQRIVNNREDAEDVAQESFHKAFIHIRFFHEQSLFSTWLTRIAMNEALMVTRRRRRKFEVPSGSPDEDTEFIATTFADQRPNPEQYCWRQECGKLLAEAINRLSPDVRRTILLYDIEEHSANETARILGTSIGAVKSRVNRGHEKLRITMNPIHQSGISAATPSEAQC